MNKEHINEMLEDVRSTLLAKRDTDGMWRGALSSSAISTSVSVFALHLIGGEEYKEEVERGMKWLTDTMTEEGSWGDSVESPANMTATLLSYTSLYAVGCAPEKSREFLKEKFGGYDDEHIVKGVLNYYGSDLTFSVPILSMCALSGVISSWKSIPPFPFELAVLPQKFFRFLNLPVVSYAIPALIAIGILQLRKKHGRDSLAAKMREPFVKKTLEKLIDLQPEDGGFLEAAPLTAFVSMCLSAAGYNDHVVTQKSARFLIDTQREDGAWPIDTDLAGWVTSLAGNALGDDLNENYNENENCCTDKKTKAEELADIIKQNATKKVHVFTGAPAGGWGWTNLTGSVPDGDDTSGALVALHKLTHGTYSEEVGKGLEWLMKLQNNDGGMPTFCKGWGKLPFDRSSPDITAHAVLAMGLWMKEVPEEMREKCERSFERMMGWLEKNSEVAALKRKRNGGKCESGDEMKWTPLWFGDQDAEDEKSHVYGTATLMDYLNRLNDARAHELAKKGVRYLVDCQNEDGGWGGQRNVKSKVTLTAKAIAALSSYEESEAKAAVEKGVEYLYHRYQKGTLYEREPIGLYFARLWYSEELYNMCYLIVALKNVIKDNE